MGIEVAGLTSDALRISYPYRRRDGLLVNDSLIAAMMEAEGISNIATADPGFTRVEGLIVYGASGFCVGREGQRRYSLRHERQRLVRTDSGD